MDHQEQRGLQDMVGFPVSLAKTEKREHKGKREEKERWANQEYL
jgi:hypothetical protein